MSDRFDIRLERKLESGADDAPAGGGHELRRIELITGTGRRRQWSGSEKARILVESFEPGANVSEVARRNGLSPQQLFAWRREARALFQESEATEAAASRRSRRSTSPQPEVPDTSNGAPAFVPVVIAARRAPNAEKDFAPSSPAGSAPPPARAGMIEIAIGDTVVRVIGDVETATLIAVLRAVRRAS
jgi:transposase